MSWYSVDNKQIIKEFMELKTRMDILIDNLITNYTHEERGTTNSKSESPKRLLNPTQPQPPLSSHTQDVNNELGDIESISAPIEDDDNIDGWSC